MFVLPPRTREGLHRTPFETAERGSRALRGLAEQRTRRSEGCACRGRRNVATMPRSWCLPRAAAAEEEEEERGPAEGTRKGGGGGLENGTDRRRCGREHARGKATPSSERASIAAPSAPLGLLSRTRADGEPITLRHVLVVPSAMERWAALACRGRAKFGRGAATDG